MFYSQFILAKKGPLGTIWIAAHLERKLRKNQVADTDIGVSVDSILFPEVPIALRLSSHLLLGVVRIYSRKVNYLFHDCSEALLKVKQAFRSTAVDLPPEESTAPYHSITLPETFDLDDFELPDSENFQGNYVDHHVSTREQITLQDTMDGVVYSTSQFGLDERFGDGDTSHIGLDLDEELFSDKVTAPGHTAVSLDSDNVNPQASSQPMTPYMEMDIDDDQPMTGEDRTAEVLPTGAQGQKIDSNAQDDEMIADRGPLHGSQIQSLNVNENAFPTEHFESLFANPSTDLTECAPSTPRLVEEMMSSNGLTDVDPAHGLMKETSLSNSAEIVMQDVTCDHRLESEYRDPTKLVAEEILGNLPSKQDHHMKDTNGAGDCSLFDDKITESEVLHVSSEETLQVTQAKQQEDSPSVVAVNSSSFDVDRMLCSPTSVLAEESKSISPASGCLNRTSVVTDIMERTETSQNGAISDVNPSSSDVDHVHSGNCKSTNDVQETSKVILQGDCVLDKETSGSEAFAKFGKAGNLPESCTPSHALPSSADVLLGSLGEDELNTVDTKTCSRPEVTNFHNLDGPHKKSCVDSHVFRACSSRLTLPDVVSNGDGDLLSDVPDLSSTGAEPCSLATLGEGEPVHPSRTSDVVQGEECQPSSIKDTDMEAKEILESAPSDGVQADLSKLDERLDTVLTTNVQSENLKCPASCDLAVPEPERLLSAPAAVSDAPSDLLVECTPEKEVSAEREGSGNGLKILSGQKRRLMESTPVLQDGSSAKLSRMPRSKRTVDSIPDDDDLLSSLLVGRRSSVLKLRSTSPPPEIASKKRPRVTPRTIVLKRKVLLDDTMVLHGDTIRQQLTSTEDVRRLRKKAPCTRPEIWMLQKQLLEDEIFIEPLFTGISADLVDLQTRTYDLTVFRAFEVDVDHTLSEVPNKVVFPRSTDLLWKANTEGTDMPIVVGNGGEVNEPAEMLSQIENREERLINSIGCDTEQQRSVTDISAFGLPKFGQEDEDTAIQIDKDNGVADIGAELPLLTVPIPDERCNETVHSEIGSLPMDKSNEAETVRQNDGNLDLQSVEKDMRESHYRGDDAINVAEVNEDGHLLGEGVTMEKGESVIQGITECGSVNVMPQNVPQGHQVDVCEGCSSPITVLMVDKYSVENGADVPAVASSPLENDKPLFTNMSVGSDGATDLSFIIDDHAKEIRSELGHVIRNVIVDENVGDDAGHSSVKDMSHEEPQRDFLSPLEFNANVENVPFDEQVNPASEGGNLGRTVDGDNPGTQEANLGRFADAETTLLGESWDLGNTLDGKETEFLNFDDDDDAIEEEDNSMPSTEESHFLDNSGWSSRTRGVARYLQNLFDNESGHGRKVLFMDNLLSGKTRKEASRMFFETLVLKTRDYIHVEQENPFDTINIKPRVKLVKSEF